MIKKIKNLSLSNITFLLLATSLLWIKTYVVYKLYFDIKIESAMQELILFINPISFLAVVLGISLFLKKNRQKRYIIISSAIITFVLFANVIYYRFFNDFITIPVLFQTSNMGDLGNSIFELLSWKDSLMFADVIFLAWLARHNYRWAVLDTVSKKDRRIYFTAITAIAIINLGLAEAERPQLLTRTFDREMLVKNIGTYNYHVYDIVLQSKSKAQKAFADSSELVQIENYVKANYNKPNEDMYGVAKGKNIIMVSMESLQSFVINKNVYSHEITPFLNDFISESFYFDNFYHQTGQGKTSDSEFITDNSLYPLGRGAVFFTHGTNEYNAIPEIVKNYGYNSAVLHANNKSFWNRDVMYQSLGYDKFFDIESYEVTEENSVGWGLKDKEFFDQSLEHLQSLPQPFYAKLITLTNHFPFKLGEEDTSIPELESSSKTLNRYFPTVRYMDEALEQFINDLKTSGLYENSIIVLYGDHYGISENHNEAMGFYLKRPITPFESVQLQRVPLYIHIPELKDEAKIITKVSGQIDMKPTLLHLLGIDTKNDIQFGSDLFAVDKPDFTVLRDGSFITKNYVYTNNTCYDKASGQEADRTLCEPYEEKAKSELSYSDQIIYGDLLRFYDGRTFINK
ncbi:LTA synthase family protein [Bacillus sp. HMF5848]|uniref:LTA synthase family protein n=1 Tax=Bacillus sp. HMF5848 TaxID=2495421 RepID=UPI000F76AF0E|nr:LTA synthase family protein [Bacillus sp. HMF5848]RSK27840.1 LTA synthase family protein [Bacillus sp. HMF5848]